jgi:hypothetical protein
VKRSIGTKLVVSCAAVIVGLPMSVHAQNAAIAVRSADAAGEADIVVQSSNNALLYYHATPGSGWSKDTIAPAGSTFSAPSIVVTTAPAGEADVVAQGPNNSLLYYHVTPGSTWSVNTIGQSGSTFSAPSIAVRSTAPAGEADVVAQGPNNSLLYYHSTPGSAWSVNKINQNYTAFTAPAIAVRPTGEADIVVAGNNGSGGETLVYYHATPGSAVSENPIPGSNGAAQTSPAIAVRPTGEADVVMALGAVPGTFDLFYFWATPGSPWSNSNLSWCWHCHHHDAFRWRAGRNGVRVVRLADLSVSPAA